MSTKENEKWLEAAWDSFIEAVDSGNLEFARAIIQDTMQHFNDEGLEMQHYLLNTPADKFSIKSFIQRHDL